jgi:hypothetical protein
MGTVTAGSIIDKAATLLVDQGNTRWTRAELLSYVNLGQRQICVLSPGTNDKAAVIQLVLGTKQSIPSDGWKLMDVVRNMGTNGTTPGRAVRLVSRDLVDSILPNWHAARPNNVVQNYMVDKEDKTSFHVYPPNTGNGYVEITYAYTPANITTEATAIAINDIYEPVLLDYVLYRACSKDAEFAPGVQLAGGYLSTFLSAFPNRDKVEQELDPNEKLGE